MKFTKMMLVICLAAISVLAQAQEFTAWSAPVYLGSVNVVGADQNPAISKDGLSLYFGSDRPGGFGGADIWVSRRASVNDPWGEPENLGPSVNTAATENTPELSPDGHRLYFQSNRAGGFGGIDLYVSRRHNRRDDFGWGPARNLGPSINSPFQEQGATVFEDDVTGVIQLYFVSNRPGGVGGNDIYVSNLQPDETFGPASLVTELSSPFDEGGPGIRHDGLEILFPSNRPGSLSLDIWVASRESTSDAWSLPENLGSMVNGLAASNENGPELSFDGTTLYFSSNSAGGVGGFDLYVSTRTKLKNDD